MSVRDIRQICRHTVVVLAVSAAKLTFMHPAIAQDSEPPAIIHQLLEVEGVHEVERGKPFVRIQRTRKSTELRLIGVVRVPASFGRILGDMRVAREFQRGRYVTAGGPINIVGESPRLQSFLIPHDDLEAIRDCSPGRCDVKLPARTIRDLAQIDVDSPAYRERVNTTLRGWLAGYIADYISRGNTALAVYADKPEPQTAEAALHQLLAHSESAHHMPKDLVSAVGGNVSFVPGAQQSFFWTTEEFGLRPLTTVTEATFVTGSGTESRDAWLVLKQLYASHYLTACLKTIQLVEGRDSRTGPTSYLVVTDQYVFDTELGGIKRSLVRSQLLRRLADRLLQLRDRDWSQQVVAAEATPNLPGRP